MEITAFAGGTLTIQVHLLVDWQTVEEEGESR